MSGFLSQALSRLMVANDEMVTAARTAGKLRRRRPAVIEEIIDVREPHRPPVIRWSVFFQSREDAIEFDGAVLQMARAVSEEEE